MASEATFDASDFFAGMRRGGEVAAQAARKAMAENLLDLERRAKELAPVETGTLARSIHALTDEIVVTPDRIEGIVVTGAEASDYAIPQHEDVLQHTHPHEGEYASKYLEGPLKAMGARYSQNMADAVKGVLGT